MCSTNKEKFFAKTVPVSMTEAFSTNFKPLFLTIEWQQTSAVNMKKELFITLTDDNDPFFLYNLQLSEDDFLRLKSSQTLLMDFATFPETAIKFIELCLNDAHKHRPVNLLRLIMGETIGSISSTAQLVIEQTSELRPVALLSLKFLAATESTIKQHMTVCYRNLKEENQNLQNRLCCLEKDFKDRFSACESALEKKSQELEVVKKNLSDEINQRESKYIQSMMDEREKLLNKQLEGENRLESERRDRETKLKRDISQLETKVSCLESINKELENNKFELERQLNELRSHNLNAENELRKINEALMIAEKKNAEFLADLKERNEHTNHLMGNSHHLNEEIRLKQSQIHNMQKELDSSKKEKKDIAKDLATAKEQLKDERKLRKEAQKDFSKANQIISKMQLTNHNEFNQCEMLNRRTTELTEHVNKIEQDLQDLNRELQRERNINLRLGIEIQAIPTYQRKIAELKEENKKLELVNKGLTQMFPSIPTQYAPLPNFAEKFPALNEENAAPAINIQASGDYDLHKKDNSAPPASGVRPKSMPSRLGSPLVENGLQPEMRQIRTSLPGNDSTSPISNANSLQPDKRQMGTSTLGNSATSTSQVFNTKSSTIISSNKNSNQSNLEINANGLSSEFKGLNLSKHSTARKQANLKSSRLPVKT